MAKETWRETYRPRIVAILEAHPHATPAELRALFLLAWDHAMPRHGWPYKVWRDEIRIQCAARGLRGVVRESSRPKHARPRPSGRARRAEIRAAAQAEFEARQMRLL